MAGFAFRTTIVALLISIVCLGWTTPVATAGQPAVISQAGSADSAGTTDATQQQRRWVDYYQRAAA